LEASAPGKEPSTQNFDTPSTPTSVTLTVPVLKDSAGGPAPIAGVAGAAPVAAPPPAGTPAPAPAPAPSSGPNIGAIVSGIATGAFVTGAVVTGVMYSSKRSDFNDDPSNVDKHDSAQTLGIVNAVLIGGAAVSAGVLVYFLVTGSKHESAKASTAPLQLTPIVSPQVAGLMLGGTL
ncbi:MAG TPA: hypothetical protein VFK05_36985, partial [Polyangiaceae bacterium]|nr:hypothetical protein [Polyangiaceae bacterium]